MRSTKGFRKLITIFALAITIFSSVVGVGYAQWNFSGDTTLNLTANASVIKFKFGLEWVDEDVLTDEAHDQADIIQKGLNGLNDSSSSEGKALKKILDQTWTAGYGYVGNMSANLSVRSAFSELGLSTDAGDYACMIVTNADGSYDYYVTYENIFWKSKGTKVVCYKTHYEVDPDDGKYYPTQSVKGTIQVQAYCKKYLEYQNGIDYTTFKAS